MKKLIEEWGGYILVALAISILIGLVIYFKDPIVGYTKSIVAKISSQQLKQSSETKKEEKVKGEYTITIPEVNNGTITASKLTAKPGEEITLIVTPNSGYKLKSIFATMAGLELAISDNKFTMPEGDVDISCLFEK